MTGEEWAAYVAECELAGDWTNSNAEWLTSILQTDSAKRLFGELLERHRVYERSIALADFTTDAGVRTALVLQGEMKGIGKVLDLMQALTEQQESPDA